MPTPAVLSCLNCGKPIRSGRIDKKFCSAGCKDAYHNAHKIKMHREIQTIDLALKKNRNILKDLFNPRKETTVSRDALLQAGFDFRFYTHHIITRLKKNKFTFCYDYGYGKAGKNNFRIIKSFS